MDPLKKIEELEAKRAELEQALAKSDTSEADKDRFTSRLSDIHDEIMMWGGMLLPRPSPPARAPQGAAGLMTLSRGMKDVFGPNVAALFATDVPSDKLSKNSSPSRRKLDAEVRALAANCVVCGYPSVERSDYPGTRPNHTRAEGTPIPVTVAHILPNTGLCGLVGVPFDKSNFLALCGTKGEQNTCHHAFDHHLMCFVRQEPTTEVSLWTVYTTSAEPYRQFTGTTVDLTAFRPHRRALHVHAAHCVLLHQVQVPDPNVLKFIRDSPEGVIDVRDDPTVQSSNRTHDEAVDDDGYDDNAQQSSDRASSGAAAAAFAPSHESTHE